MNISVSPCQWCNFNCSFCYLSKEERSSSEILDLNLLEKRFNEVIRKYGSIGNIEVYGGEISLLPEEYLDKLFDLCFKYGETVGAVTNLSIIHPSFLKYKDLNLAVSYDLKARESRDLVRRNILTLGREAGLLLLGSPGLFNHTPEEIVKEINLFKNIKQVELKPYSKNQNNAYSDLDQKYVNYVKEMIPLKKNFAFINDEKIRECLEEGEFSFSDDHIYIRPNGRFSILCFDEFDCEFFKEIDLDFFEDFVREEREYSLKFCEDCPFYGHCLTEHYRRNSCSGFRELLEQAPY